jgi:hypothetical protein
MRKRIKTGTLVGSTNTIMHILSKRLVVKVIYTNKLGVISKKSNDIRQTLTQ